MEARVIKDRGLVDRLLPSEADVVSEPSSKNSVDVSCSLKRQLGSCVVISRSLQRCQMYSDSLPY